jgi:hypothetical protein
VGGRPTWCAWCGCWQAQLLAPALQQLYGLHVAAQAGPCSRWASSIACCMACTCAICCCRMRLLIVGSAAVGEGAAGTSAPACPLLLLKRRALRGAAGAAAEAACMQAVEKAHRPGADTRTHVCARLRLLRAHLLRRCWGVLHAGLWMKYVHDSSVHAGQHWTTHVQLQAKSIAQVTQ